MRDTAHWDKPLTTYMSDGFPIWMNRGFSRSCENYGLLIDGINLKIVNHYLYTQPKPVGAPDGSGKPPPRWLFKLLLKLHPQLRRRVKKAKEVVESRYWREEKRWWEEERRPEMIRRNQALQVVDPTLLDDQQLADHLTACRDQMGFAYETHHSLFACTGVPLGMFIGQVRNWTGLRTNDILELMAGATPASVGSSEQMDALVKALADDHAARQLLQSDSAAEAIDELTNHSGPVGEAMRAYMNRVGDRVANGYDVCVPRARELPNMLLQSIRKAVEQPIDVEAAKAELEKKTAAVRGRLTADQQKQFDELLEDARGTYNLRDERIMLGDAWASGLTRRALLEVGRRLQQIGRLKEVDHILDALNDEIVSLLTSGEGPNAETLAERYLYRTSLHFTDGPEFLGDPPQPPPPADWFSGAMGVLMAAVGEFMVGQFGEETEPSPTDTEEETQPRHKLTGVTASGGCYEGIARVLSGEHDIEQLQQGDVLVVPCTSPGFNVALPLLGAMVTERGGLLCHAAVVAREYGLPAVVNARGATKRIKTGDRVRVDADRGEIWVLS